MFLEQAKQKGAGLIEVLISMVVLSVGVLGMVATQNRSVQFNQGAMHESKATVLAGDIMDRIRANPTQASRYQIGLNESDPSLPTCTGSTANCNPGDIVDYDLATWRQEIAEVLPQGRGEITELAGPGGTSIFVVTIQYTDDRVEDASAYGQANGATPKQLIFRTSI